MNFRVSLPKGRSQGAGGITVHSLRELKRADTVAFLALTILIVFAALPAASNVCVNERPKVHRVCGRTVDSGGRPVQDVRITLLKDGARLKETTSDSEGSFDLDQTPPGQYELAVYAPGFQHGRYELRVLKPSKSCKHSLEIEMVIGGDCKGGTIRVRKKPIPTNR